MTLLSIWRGEINEPRTMRDVAEAVARRHGMHLRDLTGPCRSAACVKARHEAFYEIRRQLDRSLPQIGRFFGNRDHSTVLHGIRRHEQRMGAGA